MSIDEWEETLIDATEEVRERVESIGGKGAQARTIGVGASGDKTLLADSEAEEIILDALRKGGVTRVLSEEAGEKRGSGLLAIVDPLDGSSNFAKGIPFYCTSVALVEGSTLSGVALGVVRDLVSGDVYVGRRGRGATKNGRPIRTSGTKSIHDAVVGIDVSRGSESLVQRLAPLVSAVRRQVHFGANALEVCLVADGRTDAFVDLRGLIRVTDFAAAYLIASEAGAVVTNEDGKSVAPALDLAHRFSFVAAANKALHREIMELWRSPKA